VEFKNVSHSSLDLILLYTGRRQKAEEQVEVNEVPYRDDEPSIHTGKYKPYFREMEFLINDDTKRGQIYQWLDGYGKLRTDVDPGGYFKAEIIQAIESDKFQGVYDNMMVSFKINPGFFYMDDGDELITLTAPGTIVNLGTIYSEPYIKITGSGNIDLTINSTVYSFTAVDTYLQIDSELKYVYRDALNQGDKMVGKFPVLAVGSNAISWTGTVTKIEVIPKWREL